MAPVVRALAACPELESKVCVTGQHRQMLDQVLEIFSIQADFDLNLMQPGQSLADITSGVLQGMEQVYQQWRPDLVLVHGDTTTSMAASLSAYYAQIRVGHLEAGLRTHNKYSPWPEELNRRIAGVIADLHFAPTEQARRHLLAEGTHSASVHVTGNTVVDALLEATALLQQDINRQQQLAEQFSFIDSAKKLILVTGHRRENFGAGFENICQALVQLASRQDVQIVYPVHLNPSVQEPVQRLLAGQANIRLLPPQDYLPFVYLMERSALVLTDSGGIQEEAPSLGKPVLVMRDTTERPEAVAAGTVQLVGCDTENIVQAVSRLLDDPQAYCQMAQAHNPYGDGQAAQHIVQALLTHRETR